MYQWHIKNEKIKKSILLENKHKWNFESTRDGMQDGRFRKTWWACIGLYTSKSSVRTVCQMPVLSVLDENIRNSGLHLGSVHAGKGHNRQLSVPARDLARLLLAWLWEQPLTTYVLSSQGSHPKSMTNWNLALRVLAQDRSELAFRERLRCMLIPRGRWLGRRKTLPHLEHPHICLIISLWVFSRTVMVCMIFPASPGYKARSWPFLSHMRRPRRTTRLDGRL